MALPGHMTIQHGKQIIIINAYKLRLHKTLKDDIQRWNFTKKKNLSRT